MVFDFRERPDSRSSTRNPPTLTAEYVASGESNEAIVRAYSLAATPAIWATDQGLLYRQDIAIKPSGPEVWYITVPYAKNNRATGRVRLDFDTTGGSLHLKVSKATRARYALGGITATDHKGAIGKHGDEIDGTDIVIPACKLTAHFKHPAAIITIPTIKNLARYTGRMNSDTFLTFERGEVLFLGATGSEGTDSETEVAYQFACSENLKNEVISGITVVEKRGWDVAWVEFKDDTDAGRGIKKPIVIHVERVYNELALALALGFGG